MQSMQDGNLRFIMHYQDHLTKFAILRALTSKYVSEFAYQLLDIFLLFGAPHIDNRYEFTANIIKEDMRADCTKVHGKPRHPHSQEGIERGNAVIKDMLVI
ncbi:KRAB-A domain-containing protein 2-like [Mytilus trossulus]|uniref:KRAB-A domain-containing protein 2-like n=1 Tax=Mytilus trossulus TaxID=6551 RepID=UPI00300580C6